MKRLLFTLMLLASAFAVDAESATLYVVMQGDSKIRFEVSEDFTWKLEGNELAFLSGSSSTPAICSVSDVKSLIYKGAMNSIDFPVSESDNSLIDISIHDNHINIKGVAQAMPCRIVGVDGIAIYDAVITNDTEIFLNEYKRGIYALYLNNKSSIKFFVK